MLLNQIFETKLVEGLTRTGRSDTAVIGWGRGMGHIGHMYLASSVITQANESNGDPYFVVSRTVGKDDPLTPVEKLSIYKRVFAEHKQIFQSTSDAAPDLNRILGKLQEHGYKKVVVVLGEDQVKTFQYLKNYNGKPTKAGEILYTFESIEIISRQETNDPSKTLAGPRATDMRAVLLDPTKLDEDKFAVWRDAMSPKLNDDEVHMIMKLAEHRLKNIAEGKDSSMDNGPYEYVVHYNDPKTHTSGTRTVKTTQPAPKSNSPDAGKFFGKWTGNYTAHEKRSDTANRAHNIVSQGDKKTEAMLPASDFAGTEKGYKLGSKGQLKGKTKRPAQAGDLVGEHSVEEAFKFDVSSPYEREKQRQQGKRPLGPQKSFEELADMLKISPGALQAFLRHYPVGFPAKGSKGKYGPTYYDPIEFKRWVINNGIREKIAAIRAKRGVSEEKVVPVEESIELKMASLINLLESKK